MKLKSLKRVAVCTLLFSALTGNCHAYNINNENSLESITISNSEIEPRTNYSSDFKTFTVDGNSYKNRTITTASSLGAYGSTYTIYNGSSNLAPGRIGAHANLYNASGKVVKTAGWSYNAEYTTYFNVTTPRITTAGQYTTKGTSRVYSGGSYVSKSAYESPVGTVKRLNISISDEELAERQHLYETKNMIPAVGEDNMEGYVSLIDLYDENNQPKTPQEALAIQRKRQSLKEVSIPLYDNDGETVIGEYIINY